MNPSLYNTVTNKKVKKHIQFDLSRNETYIIDNRESLSANLFANLSTNLSSYSSDNIPFITILTSLLFLVTTVLAYINKYYVYAGLFCFFTILSVIYVIFTPLNN